MSLHELSKVGSAEAIEAYLNTVAAVSQDDVSYVLDLRNEQRYTPLHCAIFARLVKYV
jgi:ankyrin repeat protein